MVTLSHEQADLEDAFHKKLNVEELATSMSAAYGRPVPIVSNARGINMGITGDPLGTEEPANYERWQASVIREIASNFLRGQKYDEARVKLQDAIKQMGGLRCPGEVVVPLYLPSSDNEPGPNASAVRYNDHDYWRRTLLMGCCNDIAESCLKSGNDIEALTWLEESDHLYVCCTTPSKTALFGWMSSNPASEEFYLERLRTLATMGEMFLRLGNTSSGLLRRWQRHLLVMAVPPGMDGRSLQRMIDQNEMRKLTQLKHPDAKLSPKLEVKNKDLQIMGSWQKVEVPKSGNIQPRMGFCSFVWKSKLYIFGGEKSLDGPHFRDLRSIDLNNPSDGWSALDGYPGNEAQTGKATGWKMRVHAGQQRAYLFNGRPQLDYFDLVEEKWGSVKTTWTSEGDFPFWPYQQLVDFSMDIVDDKIYVFGGSHTKCELGCNLFTVLDLKTLKWRRLSGYTGSRQHPLRPEWSCPGPRRHPASWVDSSKTKLYLLFGEADRMSARINNEAYGAQSGYGYGDIWYWDIAEERWVRDRHHGNPPCPRSEMSYTYNPKLNKTIIFGGYSPTIPATAEETNQYFSYSYYADTYTFKPNVDPNQQGIWKHVLVRGFPTYRAQAHLVSDPDTGKVFLFGGYTNSQFVLDKKHVIARSFGDLWWLKMDVSDAEGNPGAGFFEGVDLEEEARTAKAGPWQRCFNCGSAGTWKKCGGTCGGKAFFCDPQCLKDGWKEHKDRHRCMNRKK